MRLGNKGNVAIITALCLPLIVGGGAYGIEVGYWRYDQVRVQQAADAASYAAAVVRRADGPSVSNATLKTAASNAAASNGFIVGSDTITINTPSTATPGDANSVEAVISRVEPPIFTTYIRCMVASWQSNSCSTSMATVKASSTASYTDAGDACVLALSPGAHKAADFSGNSTLTLQGCSVMSNSLASDSFNIQGSAILGAPCIYATGGASLGGTLTLTSCSSVKVHQPPVADPYAGLTLPTAGTPQNFDKNSPTCGSTLSSMSIKSTINLNPTNLSSCTYIIDGGAMDLNASANVTCTSCSFYLTNGASVSINGSAHFNMTAPDSGTYKGMLFMSDRTNTGVISINGDSTSVITGAIYAPDGNVAYAGNFSGASGCTQIVAQTVSWTGNTTFNDNCTGVPGAAGSIHIESIVRLSA